MRQSRDIHVTPRNESSVLLAGAGVAASAMIARYGIQEYRKYKVSSRCLPFDGSFLLSAALGRLNDSPRVLLACIADDEVLATFRTANAICILP